MRLLLAALVMLAVTALGVGVLRWRRSRRVDDPVSPRWLNENVYEKDGDRRWR